MTSYALAVSHELVAGMSHFNAIIFASAIDAFSRPMAYDAFQASPFIYRRYGNWRDILLAEARILAHLILSRGKMLCRAGDCIDNWR